MLFFIGFCGAHRTGKSTVQKAIAERFETRMRQRVKLVQMPTYKVLGENVKKNASIEERLDLQIKVLDAYEEVLKEAEAWSDGNGIIITDRVPIDTAAYLMADVSRETPYEVDQPILDYVDRTIQMTELYFHQVFYVPPGVPLVEDPTSAPCSKSYIQHISALCEHYLKRAVVTQPSYKMSVDFMSCEIIDLNARIENCYEQANRHLRNY